MKLIKPSVSVLEMTDVKLIEVAGRTCYKSEDKITEDSAAKFVEMLDKRGHRAMLEHSFASVRVVCDRGVTHEIVRHRLFAFAQESTRYCNYGKDKFGGVTFIIPPWVNLAEGEYYFEGGPEGDFITPYEDVVCLEDFNQLIKDEATLTWFWACWNAEQHYLSLIKDGWTPQQARSVLPNSLKTEIVISGNFREWQHFFNLRTAEAAHPQMREVAIPICEEFEKAIPSIKWRQPDGTT